MYSIALVSATVVVVALLVVTVIVTTFIVKSGSRDSFVGTAPDS